MYLIIVGAGEIGSQLIHIASQSPHDIVVIEKQRERAEAASQTYDCLVLNDDATIKDTLADAGADEADAIISTTDEDATNVMVMLLAQEFEIPSLVSVVHNAEHMELFRRIGVNVIENPAHLIAEYLYRAVQRPSVKDFMSLAGGAEVFEITVVDGAPMADTTIREADERGILGDEVLIVAVERGEETLLPKGATEIHPGDLLTVFSLAGITGDVMYVFTGERA